MLASEKDRVSPLTTKINNNPGYAVTIRKIQGILRITTPLVANKNTRLTSRF